MIKLIERSLLSLKTTPEALYIMAKKRDKNNSHDNYKYNFQAQDERNNNTFVRVLLLLQAAPCLALAIYLSLIELPRPAKGIRGCLSFI